MLALTLTDDETVAFYVDGDLIGTMLDNNENDAQLNWRVAFDVKDNVSVIRFKRDEDIPKKEPEHFRKRRERKAESRRSGPATSNRDAGTGGRFDCRLGEA